MLFSKQKISDFLVNSNHMLDIAGRDPVIKPAIVVYNYDDTRLGEIQALWGRTDTKVKEFEASLAEKKEMKIIFKRVFGESHGAYMEHVKFGKSLCRHDPEKKVKLGLDLRRQMVFNKWYLQSTGYYSQLLPDEEAIAKFAKLAITKEMLEEGQAGIFAANKAKEDYQMAIGQSQAMKFERDRLLVQLEHEIADLALVCRYALRDNPQQLEKLGILVYSPGYKKKKKAATTTTTQETPPTEEPAPEPTTEPTAEPVNTETTGAAVTEPPAEEPASEPTA
ncbi:MAG: hypothetical protein GY940_35945 [bacterium]|nr:hypothetical protein [bacterium]